MNRKYHLSRKYHRRRKNHFTNVFYVEWFLGFRTMLRKKTFSKSGFYGVHERMVFTFSRALCYKL